MRPTPSTVLTVVAALGALAAAPAAAQDAAALYARVDALAGWAVRGYRFEPGLVIKTATQWHVPLVAVAPLGRAVAVDVSTNLVHGTVTTYAGDSESLSGLSDTQLRVLYTLRRDRLAASVALTLPTGRRSVSTSDFQVVASAGSNFLSFPVSTFGTAFGVTAGAALAQPAGAWNVGISASVRYLGAYEPFTDQPVTYEPGLELRARAATDRLIGERARLLLGLTLSTFGTDQFTGTGTTTTASYRPGLRLIADAAFARQFGRSTLRVAAWDFYRFAGDTNGAAYDASRENVFNLEARWGYAVGPRVELEPLAALRLWSPSGYDGGDLVSGGIGVRWGWGEHVTAALAGRYDLGRVDVPGQGGADVRGFGGSIFLRYRQ